MENIIMKSTKFLQAAAIGLGMAQALSAQEGAAQRITHPSFGPGRLDESFLATPRDPWVLETRDPEDPGLRDAYIGNGLLGVRLGVMGEIQGGGLMNGFWDKDALMGLPNWGVLEFNDGEQTFRRRAGTWTNYRQRLDLRTGTLTTELDWNSGKRTSHILTRCWLSRSRPGVAVIEREVTPQFEGEVKFMDRLDGSGMKSATSWSTLGFPKDPGRPIALSAKFGARERQLAIYSKLSVEGAKPSYAIELKEQGVERVATVPVRAGQKLRVVKVVGIATDAESPSPWPLALSLAEGGAQDLPRLRAQHEEAWAELWKGRIEVGNPAVQQILNGTLFQLYCHLRTGLVAAPGPGGLSASMWSGRVFWDADFWMFPVLCPLQPELGRCIVEYRHRTLPGSVRNAQAEGYKGAQIGWESGEFGDQVTDNIFRHERHVNSVVAMAQWRYALISGDEVYLREKALPVILAIAELWADRVVYNAAKDRYEIRGVIGPDEHAGVRDNNATTNYGAAWTLRLAARLAQRFGRPCPPEWKTIADKLWIPFDEKEQRFMEFEGYAGQRIKQADTVFLFHPLGMPVSDNIKAKTLDYYRHRYPETVVMVSAAMDGIVDCQLGRKAESWASFCKLLPYLRFPYMLGSEAPNNDGISYGATLSGVLQLALYGFGGVSFEEDGLIVQPCVPPELGDMAIRGMHYGGVSFDIESKAGKTSITHASAPLTFKIRDRAGKRLPLVK